MNAAQFGAALQHTVNAIEDAHTAAVRIRYVAAYRRFLGLAPVDTGAHRAGFEPFAGEPTGSTFVRDPEGDYPHPGDGLARTVASGYQLGDKIGFADQARTRGGFAYGIMIQPPADRPLFGFPAGSKPAVSAKAPAGDWALVYRDLEEHLPGEIEIRVAKAMKEAR